MKKYFTISKHPSSDLQSLLARTVLGTNGAKYQHLDTKERMQEMDNPLYLSLIRRNKTIANVTFCQRDAGWYVRYFSFDTVYQSKKENNSKNKKSSVLKAELQQFFKETLEKKEAKQFYAYVDSENERSKQMTEVFGFESYAQIETSTFSRVKPKLKIEIECIAEKTEIEELVTPVFESNTYFTPYHVVTSLGNFYVAKKEGRIIAFAKFYQANWRIHSLPGKSGKYLVKILPYIPGLRKIFNPNRFRFLVPEAVWVENNCASVLSDFFETVLKKENRNAIMWWNANDNLLLNYVKPKIKWGVLSKIAKPKKVDLVTLSACQTTKNEGAEIYTCGIDFI